MRIDDNPEKGRKVWLHESEIEELLNHVEDTEKRIALRLMVGSGLRTKEVLRAKPSDVMPLDGEDSGHKLRVWEGKGEKYRETWLPSELSETIRVYADLEGLNQEDLLVDTTRQTIQRWIRGIRGELEEKTGDEGWQFLTAHDLRRTWGTQAIESGMIPTVVMQCGGWEDFKTFQEHYMGHHSDSLIAQEASKVLD